MPTCNLVLSRILLVTAIVLLSACTAYQYIPSHHYITLPKKKGEVDVTLNVMPTGLQAGYSVTDKFFVFATAYNRQRNAKPYNQKETDGTHSFVGGSSEVNVGLGYIHWKNKFAFEIMAGGGTGRMDFRHMIDDGSFYNFSVLTRKNNFFVEPLVGMVVNETFEFGLFSRLNYVHYFHISSTSRTNYIEKYDKVFSEWNTTAIAFLEPGVFFNVGWPGVKFNFQLGRAHEVYGPNVRDKSALFRSGLSVTIGPKAK